MNRRRQVDRRLGREVEAHLFRIAQEAVNNAVTHGRAERIEITLTTKNGAGLLMIRDDGVGLPVKADYAEGIGRLLNRAIPPSGQF